MPLVLPAGHTCPGLQTPLQPAVELNEPVTVPNRPALQGVQDACMLSLLKRPSGQGLQGGYPLPGPKVPRGHMLLEYSAILSSLTLADTTSDLPSASISATNTEYAP